MFMKGRSSLLFYKCQKRDYIMVLLIPFLINYHINLQFKVRIPLKSTGIPNPLTGYHAAI